MQSQWETTFGYYFTPNRPIYTRINSIDSDEFRASTSDVISTPNRNRKSLLRSFRFTCKVNGKLLSATVSPQIVRFTRGWARSTRTNSGHRPVTSYRHRTGTGSRYYARSDFHAKSMGNYFRLLLHSKSSDYTRMGSIDSDDFRASTSDVIPTPNRNRKSLLRSFRFTCKVNGKLLSATISLQIVRFTRG
jgi:ribulose bisphosphate carboxylase small subunit